VGEGRGTGSEPSTCASAFGGWVRDRDVAVGAVGGVGAVQASWPMLALSASTSDQQMRHSKKEVTDPQTLALLHNHDATTILSSTSSLQVEVDDAQIEGVVVNSNLGAVTRLFVFVAMVG